MAARSTGGRQPRASRFATSPSGGSVAHDGVLRHDRTARHGDSAQAEERVNKAARELGYRPSLLARGLRTKLSQTIGLVSDVVATEPYAGELIRGRCTRRSVTSS